MSTRGAGEIFAPDAQTAVQWAYEMHPHLLLCDRKDLWQSIAWGVSAVKPWFYTRPENVTVYADAVNIVLPFIGEHSQVDALEPYKVTHRVPRNAAWTRADPDQVRDVLRRAARRARLVPI